jgi:hypothetical protein
MEDWLWGQALERHQKAHLLHHHQQYRLLQLLRLPLKFHYYRFHRHQRLVRLL